MTTVNFQGVHGRGNIWDTGGGGRYAVAASVSINFTGKFSLDKKHLCGTLGGGCEI